MSTENDDFLVSKEEERKTLLQQIKLMQDFLNHPGWSFVKGGFEEEIDKLTQSITGSAICLTEGEQQLDGIQGLQVEAFRKGNLKGISAVLRFPYRLIEQHKASVELLDQVLTKREEDGLDSTGNN